MDNTIDFWIYTLVGTEMQEDWLDVECPGKLKPVEVVKARVVVNDCADKLCIGARGNDGQYWQYDSYEAYYADDYFSKRYEEHGLKIVSRHVTVSMDSLKDCTP